MNEFAQLIGCGELDLALAVGAGAISTVRRLLAEGERRDWEEAIGGQLEDRGHGADGLIDEDLLSHRVRTALQAYALFENARRALLGLDREAYALQMGTLFSPFTRVAAQNQHAMSQEVFTAQDLATVTMRNRLIADPFPRRMVARDQANQGAAVLVASLRKARELGIPESRWVYLHGAADVAERRPMERQDLWAYPAAGLASQRALEVAGIKVSDVQLFDFYSCFPVAVFDLCDALGIADTDPRPLTVTGGLPFFGGAGNNYSMHAIAAMVRALRAAPGTFGFVGANGGYLSKYSVGIYSTRPSAWSGFECSDLQAEVGGWEPSPLATDAARDCGLPHTRGRALRRHDGHRRLCCRRGAHGARRAAWRGDHRPPRRSRSAHCPDIRPQDLIPKLIRSGACEGYADCASWRGPLAQSVILRGL